MLMGQPCLDRMRFLPFLQRIIWSYAYFYSARVVMAFHLFTVFFSLPENKFLKFASSQERSDRSITPDQAKPVPAYIKKREALAYRL